MEESSGPNKKAIIGLVVIVLLVIAATGVVIATGNNNSTKASDTTVASTSPSPSSSTSAAASSSSTSSFKDGTYNATGSYDSPGGKQSVDVKVTLAGGTVTDVSLVGHPNDSNAQMYQSQFESAYKTQVVGKKITDINLSRVAGSSLTSIGFNNAISDIEKQAQA
ncbi:MAG: hypothetical protein JWO07_225 [Candidatus Saccharibacteria bacterium]|nr:hypothetical protein [Candidatus Saccharibacteria bacterium]